MQMPIEVRSAGAFALAALASSFPVTAQDQATAKAGPVFADGQAQVVPAFADPKDWVVHDLWVETEFDSDGDGRRDRVHVDVTRPKQTDTEGLEVPVVYETSPYFSGVASTDRKFFWDPQQEVGAPPPVRTSPPEIQARISRPLMADSQIRTWVPRGFAVVHSASPGTGLSQGCPTVGGPNEELAPKAVIDWLNGRAMGYTTPDGDTPVFAQWSTGKVGMIGTSYNGTLPLAAATTGVEGLEAIIPVAPNTSYYHYYRSHGLVRHPGGWMGEDIDVLYDFIHSGDPAKRAHCNSAVRDAILLRNLDRESGDYSRFWADRNYRDRLLRVRAAVLMAHAFNDWNVMPDHSVEVYLKLRDLGVPTMAYFHQGGHGGEPPLELMNKWFTRYLYGIENGVEDLPRSWITREKSRRTEPTAYPDYPHPDAAPVTLHPTPGGRGVGNLATAPGEGRESLTDDVNIPGATLAAAPESANRLLYATPELTQPVHLSGYATLKIRVASDKPAANLSVWLVALPWTGGRDIHDDVITRGWADPQNHSSLTAGEPLEPGRFYDLEFTLQPDDQVIPAGQRIGLMIFSSDRDFTLWPAPGTELTVDLAGTALTIPVVGGAEALRTAVGGR